MNCQAGKQLCLGNIGRHQQGERKQLFRQRLHGVCFQKRRAGGRDHHGVQYYIDRPVLPQFFRNHMNQFAGGHHADFNRIGRDVLKDCVQLLPQKLWAHLLNRADTGCILCRQRRDCAHRIDPLHGHGLKICLNSRAAAAIAPRNAERCVYLHVISSFRSFLIQSIHFPSSAISCDKP